MTFREKLRKLIGNRNRSEVAREVEISPAVLNSYVNRGSQPLARVAVKLAKRLNVPAEWLLDDTAGWPPPANVITLFSAEDLAAELGRRAAPLAHEVIELLREAESIDWAEVVATLHAEPLGVDARQAERHAAIPAKIDALIDTMRRFAPRQGTGEQGVNEPEASSWDLIGLVVFSFWLESLPGYREAASLHSVRQRLKTHPPDPSSRSKLPDDRARELVAMLKGKTTEQVTAAFAAVAESLDPQLKSPPARPTPRRRKS